MKAHAVLDDELCALAALHALGALEGEESASFARHLAEGCSACQAEVDAMAATARQLAYAAPPTAGPPPALRERLLAEARAARPEAVGYEFVRATEGTWHELAPGFYRKALSRTPGERSSACLVRLDPGAAVIPHAHVGVEHCLVVSGDVGIGSLRLTAGDYHRAAAGSIHSSLRSEGGCVLLIVEAR